ncbi:MAG: divalent-cation tolerance protein CutA [Desulfocapsaceae bacterium]
MVHDMQPIVVTTSIDKEDVAQKLAELVIKERLAACVQILPPVTSLYWWQGEIASDKEFLLNMKSDRILFDRLVNVIRSVHSYEVPEIIATGIVEMDQEYANWMKEELGYD